MNLRTKDLLVRDFRSTDLNALHEVYSDPEVMEYLGGPLGDVSETKDEMEYSCLGEGRVRFAVMENDTGRFVGETTFILHDEPDMEGECEIGWTLRKEYWNRGYAQQLTEAFIEEARKKGARAVFLCCEEEQEIPKHIAEKFGMAYYGLEWGQAMYRMDL